jgi:hypothetical protein
LPFEGVRSYKPKIVAYRNDFCLSCEAPRRSHQIRSFKMYHVYFIPVVPLGFWREWQCSDCGRNPHKYYPRDLKRARWVAVLLTGFFAIAGIVSSFDKQDSPATVWLMRLGLPALFFAMLWFALRDTPDRALRDKLKQVSPDQDNTCALCSGALVLHQESSCSQCGAKRKAIFQI